jgi:hypothetical protein
MLVAHDQHVMLGKGLVQLGAGIGFVKSMPTTSAPV